MYGTHGAEISTQKADSFASSYAVSSGNMSLEGVAISDTTKAGLFDLDHGSVMFAQNIHEKSYPASITKIMTAILAFKHGNMDDIVTIPAEALNQESGSTEIGFQEGDQVTLDELLHGLLIYSGNDAAVAIAQHIGGSVDQFVEMMNQEALELGATNTHFANPSGLQDENHYTTVRDLTKLLSYALQNDTFRQIYCTSEYTTSATASAPEGLHFLSTMFKKMDSPEVNGGEIEGGKTGYTGEAGQCLASLAKVDDVEYILVTAGAPGGPSTEPYHIEDAKAVYNRIQAGEQESAADTAADSQDDQATTETDGAA